MPNAQTAAQPDITVEQLGKAYKQKFPAYASANDIELGRKVKEKYPDYAWVKDVPDPAQTTQAPPQQSGLSKAWQTITTPVSQLAAGNIKYDQPGKNGKDEHVSTPVSARGFVTQYNRDQPKPTNPVLNKARTALDVGSEEAAGFVDSLQSPLGIATLGAGSLLAKLPWGQASKVFKVGKLIAAATKLGFGAEQVGELKQDFDQVVKDPSTESISRLVAKSALFIGMATPEVRNLIRSVAKTGSAPESKPVPPKPQTAKDYGVPRDLFEEVKAMPDADLQRSVADLTSKADELSRLRKFNEAAGGSLESARAKINKLREDRDAAELAFQDTGKYDKQIADLEQRYKALHDKVATNHESIEKYKRADVDRNARLLQDEAARRRATPGKAKPGEPAKLLNAAPVKPKEGPSEGPAIPMGPAQPTKFKSVFDNVLPAGAEQPQITAGGRGEGPIPQPGKVRPNVELDETKALPAGTGKQPAQIEAPKQRALPPAPIRTPEGAIIAGPVTEKVGKTAAPPTAKEPVKSREIPKADPAHTERVIAEANRPREQKPLAEPTQQTQLQREARRAEAESKRKLSGESEADRLKRMRERVTGQPPKPPYEKPPIRDKANAPLPDHIQSADPEVQEAYKRLQRLKSEKGSTNPSGQEPADIEKLIPDMVTVGKHYLKLGANNFQAWSERMVADFGEKVRPVLQRAWESVSGESSGARRVEEKSPVGADDQFKKKVFLQKGKVTEMTRHELDTDPKQFQYKGKAVGKGGVTDKLKDVDFDPEAAGVLAVWKDPESGKTYVVNGHHRLERAHAAKYDEPLLVRHLSAKTAGEARMAGALINIREGNGDVIDAAKVFREGGFDADKLKKFNISRNSPIAKGGLALSKLDDQVFEDVATGKIPEDKGVVIGETLEKPADQKAAAKLAVDLENRNRRVTPSEFRETLNFIKNGPKKTEANQDLFGSYEVEKNLYVEKGEVSDYIKNQLSTETKLFGTVGKEKNVALLQGTGNQINAEANAARSQQAAQALDVYNRLKNVSGPVADILDSAAKELAEGGKPGEVKQRAYQRIFDQLGKDLSQIFGGGNGKTGSGSGSTGGTEGVRLSAGVRAGEQQGLGTEAETEKFNKSQADSRQSAEMQAKLNSKIGKGDRGHVVEESSPLFQGKPIEERKSGEAKPSPQVSMFDETEKPKGKTATPPKAMAIM